MKEKRSYKLLIAISFVSILLLPVYGQSAVGVSKCVTKCQEVHCPLDVNQKLEDCVLKHENSKMISYDVNELAINELANEL